MIRETLVLRNGKWLNKREAPALHRADAAPMVIGDLPEYRAIAADKETGKRPVIGGRRQHREFLSRNGYVEVGNEMPAPSRDEMPRSERVADIKRVMGWS